MANPAVVVDFIANTANLVAGVKDIGKATDQTAQSAKKLDFKKIVGFAAGATAMAAGAVYIKKASDSTAELAKSTQKLARATGLDVTTASAWVSTLEGRGIAVDTFSTSLVKLSKAMEKARQANADYASLNADYLEVEKRLAPIIAAGGTAGKNAAADLDKWARSVESAFTKAQKAEKPFRDMGVSLEDVRKGDVNSVVMQLADGFKNLKSPAEKAAAAAYFFGRTGGKLAPLLEKGSKGIEKQLDLARKYGAVIGKDQVGDINKNIEAQRSLKLAQKGVEISIGSALLPLQVQMYTIILSITDAVVPLARNLGLLTPIIVAAGVAWFAYKIAAIAAMVAQLGLTTAMLPTIGIIAAIVVGVALLAAGFIVAYKKVEVFRNVVDAVFNWIKDHWVLVLAIMLGPISLAVYLIIKTVQTLMPAIRAVIDWIKGAFVALKNAVLATLNFGAEVWQVIQSIGRWIVNYYSTIIGWGLKIGKGIYDGVVRGIEGLAGAVSGVVKAALNAVIGLWNRIPSFKINLPKPLHDLKVGLPHITALAQGGIVTKPTLALIGEAGPEAVVPLDEGAGGVHVRVYIGETELRGIVRTEVDDNNVGIARTLLAGGIA